jgi:acetyltransferase-like isoleucine patch superfamily enzyme
MTLAGVKIFRSIGNYMASLFAPPHKARTSLALMNSYGYIDPKATVYHEQLYTGKNVFVADRVLLYQARDGGKITLGDRICILRDCILETALGGEIILGDRTWIHPRCQLNAYLGSIVIGKDVQIAPNCAFYAYDHSFLPNKKIIEQPLKTKGSIIIEDGVWIGFGVIVLSGVKIGEGAVIGAGSIVTSNIEGNCIAIGRPAKRIKSRDELNSE